MVPKMIPVKLQCECGQHYAFDVEADGELQPGTVACPACGADGTAATNAVIAQNLSAVPAVENVAARPRIHIAVPPPSTPPAAPAAPPPPPRPRGGAPGVSPNNRTQAEIEAKAKILWGDPPKEVINFLMIRGLNHQEASETVRMLFKERLAAIRADGIGKILTGIFVALGSASSLVFFVKIGFISIWLLGAVAIAGVYGLWTILVGVLKVLAPKSERGDASDND
jgi:hypothetical protein